MCAREHGFNTRCSATLKSPAPTHRPHEPDVLCNGVKAALMQSFIYPTNGQYCHSNKGRLSTDDFVRIYLLSSCHLKAGRRRLNVTDFINGFLFWEAMLK